MDSDSSKASSSDHGSSSTQTHDRKLEKNCYRHYERITDTVLLRPWLVDHLSRAVRDFMEQHPGVIEQSPPSPPPSSSSPKADREFRFTILLTWVAVPSAPTQGSDNQAPPAGDKQVCFLRVSRVVCDFGMYM